MREKVLDLESSLTFEQEWTSLGEYNESGPRVSTVGSESSLNFSFFFSRTDSNASFFLVALNTSHFQLPPCRKEFHSSSLHHWLL